VIPISVPGLRERREDIELLANHFLKKYAAAAGKSIVTIHPDSLSKLQTFHWPGNVRQLENTIERAVALETGVELRVQFDSEHPKVPDGPVAGNGLSGLALPAEGLDF